MKLTSREKKIFFISILFLLFGIKLFIVSIQPIYILNYIHDDFLFVLRAFNILNGNYLGNYNDIILSKGIIGSLFIALANITKLGYLKANHLIYFIACLSIIHMLSNVIKSKKWLLIIYIIILFNPISYSDAVSFVYRDGIYISLIMLFFSLSFEMFFNYKSLKKIIFYSITFGITFTCIYLCREETTWLYPYLILQYLIITLFIIKDKSCLKKFKKIISMVVLPVVILGLSCTWIATLNYKYYQRFVINDFTSKDFKDAYGALTRIKQDDYINRVPLNKKNRLKLYELSPTFNELKSYLENDGLKYTNEYQNEYNEGFLYWAVREGTYKLGYYQNAQKAKDFYKRLANEINDLCDNNKLSCYSKRSSLTAPFIKEEYSEFAKYVPKTFITQLNYSNVYVKIPNKNKTNRLFNEITLNKDNYTNKDLKSVRLKVMNLILRIYQNINIYLMIISIVLYTILIVKFFKTNFKNYKEIIVLSALFCLYIVRILAVAFVAATEYKSAINKCQYLSCCYVIQSLFTILAIIFFLKEYKNAIFNLSKRINRSNKIKH